MKKSLVLVIEAQPGLKADRRRKVEKRIAAYGTCVRSLAKLPKDDRMKVYRALTVLLRGGAK